MQIDSILLTGPKDGLIKLMLFLHSNGRGKQIILSKYSAIRNINGIYPDILCWKLDSHSHVFGCTQKVLPQCWGLQLKMLCQKLSIRRKPQTAESNIYRRAELAAENRTDLEKVYGSRDLLNLSTQIQTQSTDFACIARRLKVTSATPLQAPQYFYVNGLYAGTSWSPMPCSSGVSRSQSCLMGRHPNLKCSCKQVLEGGRSLTSNT